MQINNLMGHVAELDERLKRTTDYWRYKVEWGTKNYLAIGNSLTFIEKPWGRGICSTKPDNDYFGIINKKLNDWVSHRCNFSIWERTSERNKTLDLLDVYLSTTIDVITIQLGENVFAIDNTYEADLEKLIDYIKKAAPKAQVIIIDDFWNDKRSKIRKAVSEKRVCHLLI